jgi:sigma-B regulation protein RsbQ
LTKILTRFHPVLRYLNDGDYIGGFHTEDIDNLLAAVKSNYKQWVQGFAPAAIHTPDTAAVADFSAGLLDVRPDVAYSILNTIFRSDFRHVLPEVRISWGGFGTQTGAL